MIDVKRVLVTGAHGFIGRHLAHRCATQGYSVIGVGHGSWTRREWRSWGLDEWHQADISSEALRQYAGEPDVIIHCAGSGCVASSFSDPLADFHRTVTTTAIVMDYVRTHSPATRVVYPSSASVYGAAKVVPIKENTRCAPVSPHGMHKRTAEQVIVYYGVHHGIASSIVRLFSVYGSGLRKQLLWDGCRKLACGDRVFAGTGAEVRDWIHVDDAADLLLLAVKHAVPQCPIANGGTGTGIHVREMLAHLAFCLRVDTEPLVFSGISRAGDPVEYIAEVSKASQWGWRPSVCWLEKVAEYAEWWQWDMEDQGSQVNPSAVTSLR